MIATGRPNFGVRHRDAALESADASAHSKPLLPDHYDGRMKAVESRFFSTLRLDWFRNEMVLWYHSGQGNF